MSFLQLFQKMSLVFIFIGLCSLMSFSCSPVGGAETEKKSPSTQDQNKSSSPDSSETQSKPFLPPPVQVEIRKVEERPLWVKATAIGVTGPYREAKLAASVEGLVTDVHFQEGQRVKEKDTLVTLEPDLWQARVQSKKGELKKMKADLERMKAGYLPEEIQAKKATYLEMKAQFQQLSAEMKRKRDLYHQKNISGAEWDQAMFSYEAAEARLQKAEAELKLFQIGYRKELIEAAQGDVEKVAGELEQSIISEGKTKIQAPFSGVVVEKKVEKGEWATVGTVVASLMDLSKIKVTIYIAERYIALVKYNLSAIITIDALPGKEFVGTVSEIVPQAGTDRNFPVRLVLENPDGIIQSGMFCRASAILRQVPKALMIHYDALLKRGQETVVIRVSEDGKSEYIPVSIGDREDDWIEIIDSKGKLQKGDRVVVTNNPSVYPGAQVVVVREY